MTSTRGRARGPRGSGTRRAVAGELSRVLIRAVAMSLGLSVIGHVSTPRAASAQEDFRSSDPGRPLRVEDATPLKLREWEYELGLRAAAREVGSGLLGVAELKAGLFRNAQLGIEIEGGVLDGSGQTFSGIEAVHGHALYQVAGETHRGPAFALRAEVGTPGTGSLGRSDWASEATGILTRSFGRLRLHGNGGYGILGESDGGDFWSAGIGFDYPIGLFSRALLGALSAEFPVDGGSDRVWLEVGSRWQLSNQNVLDVGLSTRLDQWDQGNANIELVFGISRVFGFPGLVKVPPYPQPTIR